MPRSKKAPESKGRSLDEFANLHDKATIVPRKIRDALTQLGDSWEYETDFMRRAGLSPTDLARYREPFLDHCVMVPGRNPKRAWAGTLKFAAKLRGRLQ
jgi:hypothetical protein